MKRTALITLAAMIFSSFSAAAAADGLSVSEVSAKKGIVSFEVTNAAESDTTISMTLIKNDSGHTQKQNIYYFDQQTLNAKKTETYKIEIPDTKSGNIKGSGTYTLCVRAADGEKITKTFGYADNIECAEFLQKLKDADKKVTSDDTAYVLLLPIVEAAENKNVLFSSGIDRDEFLKESDTLRQSMMNLLHKNGLSEFENVEEFVLSFGSLYNLAMYNSGSTQKGIERSFDTFDGASIDESISQKAQSLMAESYSSPEEFEKSFKLAYGLALVSSSDMIDIESSLKSFSKVNGKCTSEISNITSLESTQKSKALENVVLSLNSSAVKTADELSTVLKSAYKTATSSGGGGGSTGGGGGAGGSYSNKKDASASISVRPVDNTSSTEVQNNIFGDLASDHWSAQAVSALKSKGVISGNENGDFEPDRTVTREEFTKMAVQIMGLELIPGESSFDDVSADDWFAPYVNAAVEYGIINGISDTVFGTGSEISRQDMAVIIDRAIKAKGVTLSEKKEYTAFNDDEQIADYAIEAVCTLFKAGVINGKDNGGFDPAGSATRAEAAKIIYEAFKGGE